MDGTMSITDQVRLMRSVMGRKIMELDEYNDKAAEAVGDEAERYLSMADFLENDIAGYKTIIEDLKDGSCDYTGSLYDIASLPAELLGLYQNFYIPSLAPRTGRTRTPPWSSRCPMPRTSRQAMPPRSERPLFPATSP